MLAILLALFSANLFKPGSGLHITMFQDAMQNFEAKQLPLSEFFAQFLHSLFVNPFSALAQGNVIAVVVFALILGVALVMGGERYTTTLRAVSYTHLDVYKRQLQNMQLNITNGKKVGVYDYSFEGEEVISTKMGELNTVHLLRSSAEKEKTTELWLALDYQYVPVKIRETEKDGKVYVLLVKALKTE